MKSWHNNDSADMQLFLRRMRKGRPWVFGILHGILLIAWYPFFRQGLEWLDAGRPLAGWLIILIPGLVCLAASRMAIRAYEQSFDDVRKGRVRRVMRTAENLKIMDESIERMPIPGSNLDQQHVREFLRKGARMGGYERPDRGRALRRLMFWLLAASAFMYLRPWEL